MAALQFFDSERYAFARLRRDGAMVREAAVPDADVEREDLTPGFWQRDRVAVLEREPIAGGRGREHLRDDVDGLPRTRVPGRDAYRDQRQVCVDLEPRLDDGSPLAFEHDPERIITG